MKLLVKKRVYIEVICINIWWWMCEILIEGLEGV